MLKDTQCEFFADRALKYKEATRRSKDVWQDDLLIMYSYLAPQSSDIILEIGAGAGFFSFPIAERIGSDGFLYALDPSEEQLEPFFDKKNQQY